MKAIESQVGGSHYKDMVFQLIELITALRCSFIQGCIIKYISRYKNKNGAQDIKKCIHYAQLAIELGNKTECKNAIMIIGAYAAMNKITDIQRKIITNAVYNRYNKVIQCCEELLQLKYPENI